MTVKGSSESDLRKLIRDSWSGRESDGAPLTWIEAAPGGTNGAPDVFVPISKGRLFGLELKAGWHSQRTGKLDMKVRPTQIRWHRAMTDHRYPTGLLAYINILSEDKGTVMTSLNLWPGFHVGGGEKMTIALSTDMAIFSRGRTFKEQLLLALGRIADSY